MSEEWKAVKGYEGFYEVSTLGNVRSVDRYVRKSNGVWQFRKSRKCRIFEDAWGYLNVKLNKDSVTSTKKVHRIVYETFVGKIPDGYEIDHIDFNRKNNVLGNLTCVTHRENVLHTVNAGRHFAANGRLRGSANPNYGNNKLSSFYKDNPIIAFEKQSRPGALNGRCRKTQVEFPDGTYMTFDYIRECAMYFVENSLSSNTVETTASKIKHAFDTQTTVYGCKITIF